MMSALLNARLNRWLVFGAVVAGSGAALIWFHQLPGVTWRAGAEKLSTIRAERALPHPDTVALPPDFRIKSEHPRLPVPGSISKNVAQNIRMAYSATQSNLVARILAARIEPREQVLQALFERLTALVPTGGGDDEAKTLALAYDWLYAYWTPAQRQALLAKALSACEHEITFIRQAKLSPYNVILYNAPLQGLMTCAIALYPDHARATPIMAFTYDLWKNRVLPVWRQIMGRNGGWHEGGEYVGIGIGQAIFQLPNMWRHATGEDLFKSEPGIRGHLDFLIHRTQPDGRYVSWGDAAFFKRHSPDAIALALELRNAAAYTFLMNDNVAEPTSWPWGPALDASLTDPAAVGRLPLSKYFDGIGTVFARSDWTSDATHVSFRAGDNYWSHTHLDQGAFTVYKGGELAIDSGLYYRAMTDHHMNYTSQTIAHNTLTITDPQDVIAGPGTSATLAGARPSTRPIANDGGQRRIGSGWGVEEAPLDIDEWRENSETYHTGTIERYFEADGLTVAVADITPAYTNTLSGLGTFSHRTRRVERFWRVFAYDRVHDIVVIFDNVSATRANFKKRWLLHSVEQPMVENAGFSVRVAPNRALGHVGSTLRSWVLLPTSASIELMGGPGQEFWVGDHNYDDNGAVRERMHRLSPQARHPGAWRVEVSPSKPNTDDLFLVVMAPTLRDANAPHAVKLIRDGERVGAEIRGPARTIRWWFAPDRNGVWIELSDGKVTRGYEVMGTSTAKQWLDFNPLMGWFRGSD